MDQEALLELARKHLNRYASAFAPFEVSRAEGSGIWGAEGAHDESPRREGQGQEGL